VIRYGQRSAWMRLASTQEKLMSQKSYIMVIEKMTSALMAQAGH
jgi:hypothetical protein